MKATFYVDQVSKAIGRVKEAHALNILTTHERNVEWTARTAVILDIAIADPEINSDDYILICESVSIGLNEVNKYIF